MRSFITSCKFLTGGALVFLFAANASAQDSTVAEPVKLEHKKVSSSEYFTKTVGKLDVGGYYRGYFYSRKMKNGYDEWTNAPVMRGGDIYQNPFLFMYVGATVSPSTSLGSEMYFGDSFDAFLGTTAARRMGPFNTMVLRGSTNTKYGNFYARVGGIEWIRLSPFTFGNNVGYNRYSVWERQPWDPAGNVKGRYASYYHTGAINQDIRFGTNAFKGFMVSVNGMPKRMSADIFYGKSQNNGGFDRENLVRAKSNFGARLNKAFGKNNYVSLNTFNSTSRTDSINSSINVQWQIITSEFSLNYKGFNLNGEIGTGFYESPNYKRAWSEGVILNLKTPVDVTGVPFELRYFRIGNSFTSNVSQFQNTSIKEVNDGIDKTGNALQPFGGNLTGVGGLANNRQGFAINTDVKIRKLKITAGIQFESELKKLDSNRTLTFGHRINGLAWSRMAYNFPAQDDISKVAYGLGPNDRVKTYYRGAYEIVKIYQLDEDSVPLYKNHYNSFDLQLKYSEKIFGREAYFFLLNSFQSAQNKFSLIPKAGESAFISAHFHEGEVYYHVARDLVLSGYFGLEFIKGNKYTDTTRAETALTPTNSRNGKSGLARDQIGRGIGLGADFTISNSTSIYFRQRWIRFQDNNFKDEDFNGFESTVELKIFF